MAETTDYCVAAELNARLWPPGTTPDALDATVIANIITSVSRWMDNYTGTHFYTSANDETRYFTAFDPETLFPPDIISITTLATDNAGARTYGETWLTTDFDCLPYNYILEVKPIRIIERSPLSTRSFPLTPKSVKIIGKFGYCTSANRPAMVKEACLIQCERIFKRKDAPFGIISNPEGEMRLLTKLDVDVEQMLNVCKRFV